MRQAIHQYNQSGDLRLYRISRAVYENNAPAEQPQQAPKPPEAKVDVSAANVPQVPGGSGVVNTLKTGLMDIANRFLSNKLVKDLSGQAATEMKALTDKVTGVVEKANTVGDAAKLQQVAVVNSVVAAAPATPTPAPTPATPPEDSSLNLKEVVITEADVAAGQLLKKTEALFDTSLKGKVTPKGWLNYLGDTNGIAQDIINTNVLADNYGTFTHADLMAKNTVVSSPVASVEAIKFIQQSLGQTPDGIFGPATYDALVKKNPAAALILREEKPVVLPAEQKVAVVDDKPKEIPHN